MPMEVKLPARQWDRISPADMDLRAPASLSACSAVLRDHRAMSTQHPFHEDRPDDLPASAGVWDAATKYSGIGLTTALYQAIKQLEAEVIALRRVR